VTFCARDETRQTIARVAIVVTCWYAFVLFGRSCTPTHARWRAIQARVLADAKQIERRSFTRQELDEAVRT
jgi:hypothetical protein